MKYSTEAFLTEEEFNEVVANIKGEKTEVFFNQKNDVMVEVFLNEECVVTRITGESSFYESYEDFISAHANGFFDDVVQYNHEDTFESEF